MTIYLQHVFPDWLFTVVSVVLLAAAMSTLDGLLVGISTITANDLVRNLLERKKETSSHESEEKQKESENESMKIALKASHIVLIVIAILTFFVTLNPPKLLGIFGQVGVYGLVLAAVPPLLAGVWFKRVSIRLVWTMSVLALLIHFGLYAFGEQLFPSSNLAFGNPGMTATIGLICTVIPTLLICQLNSKKHA